MSRLPIRPQMYILSLHAIRTCQYACMPCTDIHAHWSSLIRPYAFASTDYPMQWSTGMLLHRMEMACYLPITWRNVGRPGLAWHGMAWHRMGGPDLTSTWQHHRHVSRQVPPEVLEWEYRMPLMVDEVAESEADIICIQVWFARHLAKWTGYPYGVWDCCVEADAIYIQRKWSTLRSVQLVQHSP